MDHAVSRANCEKKLNRRGAKRLQSEKFIRNKKSDQKTKFLKFDRDVDGEFMRNSGEKNKKRDIRNWYGNNENYRGVSPPQARVSSENSNEIFTRGDIPVLQGDCDGK